MRSAWKWLAVAALVLALIITTGCAGDSGPGTAAAKALTAPIDRANGAAAAAAQNQARQDQAARQLDQGQ